LPAADSAGERSPGSPGSLRPQEDGGQLLGVVALVRRLPRPRPFHRSRLSIRFGLRGGAGRLIRGRVLFAVVCSKQLLDPEDAELVPAADRERGITPEEFRLVKIHMSFRELLPPTPSCAFASPRAVLLAFYRCGLGFGCLPRCALTLTGAGEFLVATINDQVSLIRTTKAAPSSACAVKCYCSILKTAKAATSSVCSVKCAKVGSFYGLVVLMHWPILILKRSAVFCNCYKLIGAYATAPVIHVVSYNFLYHSG
jgi:hypothetical protein